MEFGCGMLWLRCRRRLGMVGECARNLVIQIGHRGLLWSDLSLSRCLSEDTSRCTHLNPWQAFFADSAINVLLARQITVFGSATPSPFRRRWLGWLGFGRCPSIVNLAASIIQVFTRFHISIQMVQGSWLFQDVVCLEAQVETHPTDRLMFWVFVWVSESQLPWHFVKLCQMSKHPEYLGQHLCFGTVPKLPWRSQTCPWNWRFSLAFSGPCLQKSTYSNIHYIYIYIHIYI